MSCQKKKKAAGYKISGGHADHFLTIWMRQVCLCTTNSEFHFLCRSFEACDRCQKVEKTGKTNRQLDAVPQQWSMSYIPRNTALFNDK
jgi:hypothetical protein